MAYLQRETIEYLNATTFEIVDGNVLSCELSPGRAAELQYAGVNIDFDNQASGGTSQTVTLNIDQKLRDIVAEHHLTLHDTNSHIIRF